MREVLSMIFQQEDYSIEVKTFNIIQAIYLIGLLFINFIINICFEDPTYIYITVLMCCLLIVSCIDVNRTGNIRRCACITSIITNFIYLPICFYGYGKLICCVPVYFILGILYTVLTVGERLGIILSSLEVLYLSAITIYIGIRLPGFYSMPVTTLDYIAILIALLIVIILSVIVIKTKINLYDTEFSRMQEARLKVIDAYNSKDIFFANTSHEIRTPLNAIVGTVNLLLAEKLEPQVKDNVYNILNSCNALLAITDELMELSNTENSDVSIVNSRYDLSEMLSEIVNMMSVRLMESSVNLYVEIDKNVPKYLYGDGGKVRQLLINILNNAVKYTKEGHITFRVFCTQIDTNQIDLKVEVEDTGIGINKEALPKIFSDYNRDEEDDEKRIIEGTGLGLSLCKELVTKMGGNISVKSEYHVGSTFMFNIPQTVNETDDIASINVSGNTSAIIFETDSNQGESLKKVLQRLSVKSILVSDRMEFETSVLSNAYNYILISAERYLENQRFIDRKLENHRLIVLTDVSQSIHLNRSCYMLTRPAHIINVAMAYNNEMTKFGREIIQMGGFTCPNTTILVVDDNITNLEVASGLMKKYDANIVTAISGTDCISAIKQMHVDIVFLDYMMPGMNGIDTLYAIRGLDSENAKNVPIIALTANVVSGAREMFLDAGFSEYITKPIDVHKLENTLKTFLPREQLRIKI